MRSWIMPLLVILLLVGVGVGGLSWIFDKSINLNGKVLDQNDAPVEGAEIALQVRDWQKVATQRSHTDARGLFSVSSRGNSWIITDISKKGYEFDPASPELLANETDTFKANKKEPIIFRVRKKEPPTLVLLGEYGISFENGVQWYEVDLIKAKAKQKGYLARWESKDLHIDVKATAAPSESGDEFTVTLEELDPGSGIIALDHKLYAAPETGYQQTYQVTVPTGSTITKYLYVKARSGQVYTRLDTEFNATARGLKMRVKSWTNPNGQRNVDFDEGLYSEYLIKNVEQHP